MNSLGYWGKHYRSMYTGSMMNAGSDVYSVMGYVIAHGEKGQVELNPKLISALIGMPEEAAEKAIAFLCAPDPNSRNKEHGGARLIKTGTFTYSITGWDKYHPSANVQDRREYMREAKRRQRERNGTPVNSHPPTQTQPAAPAPAKAQPPTPAAPPSPTDEKRLQKLRLKLCQYFKRSPNERWEYIEETALAEVAKRKTCVWEFTAITRMIEETVEPKFMTREMKNLGDFLNGWRKLLDQAAAAGYEAKEDFGLPDSERINLCGFKFTRTDGGPRREQFKPPTWPTPERQEAAYRACRTAYESWVKQQPDPVNA